MDGKLRLGETTSALGGRVTDVLRTEIESGRWAVGAKIPSESELVAWTGAGRNTVREAVGSLVQAGMLRRRQGQGTFVTARSDLTATLRRHAAANPRRDTLELRLALDSIAARLAAQRRSDSDVRLLKNLLAARDAAWLTGDIRGRVESDTALHSAIVAASHNELLAQVYAGLVSVFESALDSDVAGSDDVLGPLHHSLVAAVVEGRPADAAEGMSAILEPLIAPTAAHALAPEDPDSTTRGR